MDTINSHEGHVLNSTWQSRTFLSDRDILDIFDKIDLAELPLRAGNGNALEGLSVINDWGKILSLGEQQRLAFGRILVNRPLFVILDEATSALDTNAEKNMYSLLNGTTQKITYVSVGHRPSLLEFHVSKLTLKGIEGHSLEDIHNKFTNTSGSDGSLLS
jgi:putative ATP-binding cassette transporter